MTRKPWRKVLYENQGVPDNYTDPSFLGELRKNVNLAHFTLGQALYAATTIVQQISRVIAFVVLFAHLNSDVVQPWTLFLCVLGAGASGYLLYAVVECRAVGQMLEDMRRAGVFLAFALCLAPIMKTLTETISTDTIYALVALMLLVHLLCHDYAPQNREGCCREASAKADFGEELPSEDVWSTVSLNAALSASVCLASRLQSSLHVAALSTLAVVMFVLAPLFASWLQGCTPRLHVASTVGHAVVALAILSRLCWTSATLLGLLLLCVGFLLPAHFVHCQKYKDNIYGPWDEAVISQDHVCS